MTFTTWGQSALLSTTVAASPAPSTTAFGVASVGGLKVGHRIRITRSGSDYESTISNIAGSVLTVSPALSITPSASDPAVCYATVATNSRLNGGAIWDATSLSDLKATDTTGMQDGTRCLIKNGNLYRLDTGSSATADDVLVIAPTTGPGRWLIQLGDAAQTVTAASVSLAANGGYISNRGTLQTLTLPTTAAVGTRIRIYGQGAGGWKVAQNSSQLIHFGSAVTTTGASGYLASFNRYDCVELVCIVANTEWTAISMNALTVA